MQHDVDDMGIRRTLSNEDIVAAFPEGKKVVKRLIKEQEEVLDEIQEATQKAKELLCTKVSMYDLDIATKLVIAGKYGALPVTTEDNIARLKKLSYMYDPPKPSEEGVTDAEIARAREYPIKNLVKMKGKNTLCLWHNDRNPSMHVYPDNHAFCFPCHKTADSIEFVRKLYGLDFIGAVKYLNKL